MASTLRGPCFPVSGSAARTSSPTFRSANLLLLPSAMRTSVSPSKLLRLHEVIPLIMLGLPSKLDLLRQSALALIPAALNSLGIRTPPPPNSWYEHPTSIQDWITRSYS